MNEIVNKYLLAGEKFMPDHLPKTKKEFKLLKKQEIHDICTELS